MFNVDILPERGPDLVFDLNHPFPFNQPIDTQRFGAISIAEASFDYILADNVMEHIQQLTRAMTTCLICSRKAACWTSGCPTIFRTAHGRTQLT